MYCQQLLLWDYFKVAVIRSQSVASANGASKFYVPALRLEAIIAPLLFRHVGVLKALALLFSM